MPVLRMSLFFAVCLFLASCGGKKTVTKTTLVLAGAIDSIAGQAGGTMVYGRQTSGGTDSFAIMLPYSADLELANGAWTFAAVSWDGDGLGYPMEGATRCALLPVQLEGGEQAVSLSLSAAGCNSQFFGDASSKELTGQPKKFVPATCAFTQKDGRVDDNDCINSVAQSFLVELPQKMPGGGFAPGIVSRCIAESNPASSDMEYTGNLRIPMFFPLIADQGIIRITLFEDASCTQSPQTTLLSSPLAGVATRPVELESDITNILYIHNPPCAGIAANQATPFISGGVNILCNATQISGYVTSNSSLSYRLGGNIDFSGQGPFTNAVVGNAFSGTFDGGGHTISNLSFDTPIVGSVGLFGSAMGTIKNLNIDSSSLIAASNANSSLGLLVGFASNQINIENIQISNSTIDLSGSTTGGAIGLVVGYYNSSATTGYIRNIRVLDSTIDIVGHKRIGGAIGNVDGAFTRVEDVIVNNLTMNIDSTSAGEVGGAIGIALSGASLRNIVVSNLSMGTSSNIIGGSATANKMGGIVGSLSGNSSLENAKADGAIYSASNYVGGVVGHSDPIGSATAILKNVISQFSMIKGNFYVGGVLGYSSGSATEKTNLELARFVGNKNGTTGYIECADVCAGLVSSLSGVGAIHEVTKSWVKNANIKTTHATPVSVAGLVAEGTSATISEVFAEADVVTDNQVTFAAGLLADFTDPYMISSAYFRGSVTANAVDAALLFTKAFNATLTDLYSVSTIASGLKGDYALSIPTTVSGVYTTQLAPNGGLYLSDSNIRIGSNFAFSNATLWSDLSAAGDGNYKSLAFYKSYSSFAETNLGTTLDPFLIDSVASWNSIGDQPQFMGAVFKLTNNLDFNAQTFNPIASTTNAFHGTLLGNNKTMSNITKIGDTGPLGIIRVLTVPATSTGNVGVVDRLPGSSVYNKLYLNNINFVSTGDVGALIGTASDYYSIAADVDEPRFAIRILGVVVSGSQLTSSETAVGGLVGSLEVNNGSTEIRDITIQNTNIDANTTATHAGGVIGMLTNSSGFGPASQGRIESIRSLNNTIEATAGIIGVGGVFGYFSSLHMETRKIITNSTVDGAQDVGGVVGSLLVGRIAEATSRGSVTGVTNVGGFVGSIAAGAIVTGSYSIADVVVSTANLGAGFAGITTGTSIIQNSWSAPRSLTGTIHQAVPVALGAPQGGFSALVYVGTDDALANTTHTTDAELRTEGFYNTNFVSTDPFMYVPGLYPVPYFEVFPEYFLN